MKITEYKAIEMTRHELIKILIKLTKEEYDFSEPDFPDGSYKTEGGEIVALDEHLYDCYFDKMNNEELINELHKLLYKKE